MRHSKLAATKPGETLVLKTERAVAYGMEDTRVTYVTMKRRPGYSIPFVIAHELHNPIATGVYRLSDFR